jgi:Putative MetA-pathway of phenol degradation
MTGKLFFFLAINLFAANVFILAQSGPIQIDRPDQTECPFIVPTKYIQVEHGFLVEKINSTDKTYNYPSTLWKYGLNEKLEFRLITELVSIKETNQSIKGLVPITIGFKTNLFKEKGILPTTSFIGHITTSKAGTKDFHTTYIAPSFRFTMQHTLSNRVALAYNLGAEWDGETATPTYIYTLTTGISITEKLGCYAELYGFAKHHFITDHRFDGGFTYLVNDDIILDISGGYGLTINAPKNFLAVGLSYRFRTYKSRF